MDLAEHMSPGDEEEEEEEEVSEPEGGSDEEESSGLDSGSEDSGPDLARGVGNVETSSDEDEEEEEDEVEAFLRREEEEIEHDWGDLCKDAPRRDEVRGVLLTITSSCRVLTISPLVVEFLLSPLVVEFCHL